MTDAQKVALLAAALSKLIEAAPAFRSARIGAPYSAERVKQELHITAEDQATDALATAAVPEPPATATGGKYGVITTSGKQLHPGEPVFLLRGTDPNTCVTINDYFGHCRNSGCTRDHIDAIIRHMQRIGRWQTVNPQLVKERPD